MIIYKATNKITGKCYIGLSSFTLEKRMGEHVKGSKRTKPKSYFHRALKKYSPKNFVWEVLEECEEGDVELAEEWFIKLYKSLYNQNGYNLTLRGSGGDIFSNHPDKEKIRERISVGTKEGIAASPKREAKIWSESRKGDKNPMFGKKHKKKSLKLMSAKRKGLTAGDKNPSVAGAGTYKIYFPNGDIETIKNVKGFCREKGLNSKFFYDMCNGKREKPYKGYWCERLEHSHQKKKELGLI